jgi:hypothetical protein
MKKIAIITILLLCVGALAFAADTKGLGIGKTQYITFINDTKVGDKVLTAGEYRVLHLMEGSEHTLVFKSADRGDEKVRVKCNMVELRKKADQTTTEFNKNANGERVLTALTFAGERYRHTFNQ